MEVTGGGAGGEAGRVLRGMCGERAGDVARLVAATISAAHGVSPASWVLTFESGEPYVRLNVGRAFALTVRPGRLTVLLDGPTLDASELAGAELEGLPEGEVELRSYPEATWRKGSFEAVLEAWPALEPAHRTAIERNAAKYRRSPWCRHHRPELVEAIEELAGVSLPRPDVEVSVESGAIGTEKLGQLVELFGEFLVAYPASEAGRAHRALRDSSRQAFRTSFAEIRGARASGTDVTERVLLELLPHLSSPGNRERGAWVYVAPVINKDLKQWFEGAGWTRPEDWPAVAAAIMDLLEACTDDPPQLEAACGRFVKAVPSKGFQAAMLSPALNSLHPDKFVVWNAKPLKTVSFFCGTRHTTGLAGYPQANTAEHQLMDALQEAVGDPTAPDELFADLFDMFCHWLVAVRKFPFREMGYWKIAPGRNGILWDMFLEEGCMAMGWAGVGDISGMKRSEFDALVGELIETTHTDWTRTALDQLWQFAHRVQEGDQIVANRGTSEVLGVGTVTGPYYFVPDVEYGHRVPVEWNDTTVRAVNQGGWRKILVALSRETFEEVTGTPPVVEGGVAEPVGREYQPASDAAFTPEAFELLARLEAEPRRVVYDERREEFQKHVEEPVKGLLADVAKRLPESMLEVLETEKRTTSRIPKNDYGRGGAWPFFWGAFYPKGGRRIEGAQLFITLRHRALRFGFSFGEYSGAGRNRFHARWLELRSDLIPVLQEQVDAVEGVALFDRDRHPEAAPDVATWLDHPETYGLDAEVQLSEGEALSIGREALVERIRSAFIQLFPLVLLAVADEPLREISHHLEPDDGEEDVELQPELTLAECAAATGFPEDELGRWVRAIERKRQAVLYGPPGTGKTFVAGHLARHLVGGGDGFIELVQFHPAYAYEDFMQGLRPTATADGGLDYKLRPGRFLEFCTRAAGCEGTCVLIIDEINRANLARVFGELMYLLEYRDEAVPLAGGGQLRIPENVRLIGTMNTADRSIALVDHALRRRFAFIQLEPKYEVLERFHRKNRLKAGGLIQVLKELNRTIEDRHYWVGISFFLKEELAEHLEDIWRMEIEPYLEEFFFDQPSKVEEFRWDRVRERLLP